MEESVLGGGGDEEPPFIYRWCDKYGLSEDSAAILLSQGFSSVQELTSVTSDDIKELGLPMSQRLLLRGALLQFKENDMKYAERRSRKLGLPVEQTLFLTKNAVLELQNRPPPIQSDVPTMEELEKRAELRRRVRRKKQRAKGGVSLADQILNQRQHMVESSMGGSEVSLMSASSSASASSKASSSTLPTGHVTQPNPTRLRETRSAADINKNNNNNDINKCIEEILKDDPPQPAKSRPVSRASAGAVSRATLPGSTAQAQSEDEALVSKMDAALDRLLTEISDGVPAGAAKEVKNPKGDLKVAMDILDKELITDEEKSLVKGKKVKALGKGKKK